MVTIKNTILHECAERRALTRSPLQWQQGSSDHGVSILVFSDLELSSWWLTMFLDQISEEIFRFEILLFEAFW
jgi:hypothetical protein